MCAEEWSSHVSGKTGVDVYIGDFDFVLLIHVASLDFSMLLRVFVRVVIGVRGQLDGIEGGLLGKAAGFIAVDNTLGYGFVVAVLGNPFFGGSQSTDAVVEAFQSIAACQYFAWRCVSGSSLTVGIPPKDSPEASLVLDPDLQALEVREIYDGESQ